jgi:hypothetical protein
MVVEIFNLKFGAASRAFALDVEKFHIIDEPTENLRLDVLEKTYLLVYGIKAIVNDFSAKLFNAFFAFCNSILSFI